jgi:hypothetical protein
MSSGRFKKDGKYELDNGDIAKCRVQPETLNLTLNSVANGEPTGSVNVRGSAAVSRGRRAFGVNCRLVRIRFTSTLPNGYAADEVIALPWLKKSSFDALPDGATGTYLGNPVILVGRTAESIK